MNSHTNESLYTYRDIMSQVFRLTMSAVAHDYSGSSAQFDGVLTSVLELLEAKDAASRVHRVLEQDAADQMTRAFLERSLFEPPLSPPHHHVHDNSPTLVIHPDEERPIEPNMFITKMDDDKTVRLAFTPVQPTRHQPRLP